MDSFAMFQGASQFKSLSIVTRKTDGVNISNSERDQVVQNRSGATRLRPHPHNIVHRQAGLNGKFLPRRINLEITVQTEIAQNGYVQSRILCRYSSEAIEFQETQK